MMRYMSAASAVAGAVSLSLSVSAAAFDGSQPFICAAIEILACEPGIKCEQETAETVDLPQFLKISVLDKTVVGTRPSGAEVNAKIELVRHAEQKMFLQGVEKTVGWSMAIDEAKGRMTLTITDDENGYVVFGACTPR
jgi:hypothetical protein